MINLNDGRTRRYVEGCRVHLAAIECELLGIEKREIDNQWADRAVRAARMVKGAAEAFDLKKVVELTRHLEDVLDRIRSHEDVPAADSVQVLLRATDRLSEMMENPEASDRADIAEIVAALDGLSDSSGEGSEEKRLRMLLVEDDFASRLLLQTFLSRYGECQVAVNGREGVDAFRSTCERGLRYDLICMDIMMPEMDGAEALRRMRAMEEANGIASSGGAKIIMTTTVRDVKEVRRCFEGLCDAYLMKPIDLAQLLGQMKEYRLVK